MESLTTTSKFARVCADIDDCLARSDEFSFDFETTGLSPHNDSVRGVALAAGDKAWYLPVLGSRSFPFDDVMLYVKGLLSIREKTVVMHNGAFDLQFLMKLGIDVLCRFADTWVAAYLDDETRSGTSRLRLKGKGGLIYELYDVVLPEYRDTALAGAALPGMGNVIKDEAEYAADDAAWTLRVWQEKLAPRLKKRKHTWPWFWSVEMEITRAIAEMEYHGFAVDVSFLNESEELIVGEMDDLRDQIWALAEAPFNLGSPQQVARVFYDEKGYLPPEGTEKTKTGVYPVGKGILASLKDPLTGTTPEIVEKYLQWKGREKMLGTYVRGLRKQAMRSGTGRIHADFWQASTDTGRFACRSPNLENIPRPRGFAWQYTYPIKAAFVASPGCVIIVLDYSQLELRIMAHLSQDANMLRAYREGIDIHEMTRQALTKLSGYEVPRTIAKNNNFGNLYGQTPAGLSSFLWRQARIVASVEQCIVWHEAFFGQYPGIKAYHEKIFKQVSGRGYVTSLVGRRRSLDYLFQCDKGSAFRIGVNFTDQGSAADIIKLAMRNIRRRWRAEKTWAQYDPHFVNQVHDELVIECREEGAQTVHDMVKHEMETAMKLSVPLVADGGWGHTWLEAKEAAG